MLTGHLPPHIDASPSTRSRRTPIDYMNETKGARRFSFREQPCAESVPAWRRRARYAAPCLTITGSRSARPSIMMGSTVVAPDKPITRTRSNKFLMKAVCRTSAKPWPTFTIKVLEMQPDNPRVVEISYKVFGRSWRRSAHAKSCTSDGGRKTVDPSGIEGSFTVR